MLSFQSKLSARCLICNSLPYDTLQSYSHDSTLASGKTLKEVLSEILGPLALKPWQTEIFLCKMCYEKCETFHGLWARLDLLKMSIQAIFLKGRSTPTPKSPAKDNPKMLCLPASKLKPVLPSFVLLNKLKLNTGNTTGQQPLKQLATIPKSIATTPTKTDTTSSSMATITKTKTTISQEISTKDNSIEEPIEHSDTLPTSSLMLNTNTAAMLNFDINKLPKNFLDTAVVIKTKQEETSDGETENNEEQAMEIDEDCTFSTEQNSKTKALKDQPLEDATEPQPTLQVDVLEHSEESQEQNGADDFVIKKVEIMEEEDGDIDDHAILVEGEDGSLIRVMAGQKFFYGDNEISLIIPQDEDDNSTQDNHDDDNADSNDESQIELQVSGDEETANAIIAAAQEQGGAFIKVQSGEMYMVKSVKSKIQEPEEDEKSSETTKEFTDCVRKVGDYFRCLLCAKENKAGDGARRSFQSAEGAARHVRSQHRVDCAAPAAAAAAAAAAGRDRLATKSIEVPATPGKRSVHECKECHKTFNSRNLLSEHMNQHTGTRPYACATCGKTFASKYTHQSHLKTHEMRPRPFKCSKEGCGKSFFTQQNLAQHDLTHAGIKSFVCQTCGKAFGTAHNLAVHGVVHSGVKPFMCGICSKSFARKAEIRDHIRTHTGERPFACGVCGASFSQRSNLQSHVRATHDQDKRHACHQCGKKFKRRRLLDYHIKALHTGERPYKCNVCKATFVYPEHYKKHARIHSGERPFVCEVCGKSFNSRDNRNAHRFVHSDKKPYECLVCGAGYMRKPLLYAHMHTSGHMTESIVVNQPRVSSEDADTDTLLSVNETGLDLGDGKALVSQEDGIAKVFITTTGDNATVNSNDDLVQASESALITITQNLENGDKIEPSILESLANDEIGNEAEIVAKDENGSVVRLVQIQLASGENGWIAIN